MDPQRCHCRQISVTLILAVRTVMVFSLLCRIIAEKPKEVLYTHQKKYIQFSSQDLTESGYVNIRELAEAMCRYDLDDVDLYWLHALNSELDRMGKGPGHKGIILHEVNPVLFIGQ